MNKVEPGPASLSVVHHHPGRLRMRTEAFLDAAFAAERTRIGLARTPGVRAAAHDGRTGSLLVEYAPAAIDVEELIARVEELSGLRVRAPQQRHASVAPKIWRAMQRTDRMVQEATRGRFDLGIIVPTSLAVLSVYSFFRGSHVRLPRWDSLVFWAYSVFVHAHEGERPSP
jgi:hypothetical protein